MYSLAYFFSWIGDWERVVIIGLAILILFFYLGWRREMILLTSTIIISKALSVLLKQFIERERPDWSLWLTDASGFSFPSGHATVAMALYGGLSIISWSRLKRPLHRYLLATFSVMMVLGIGLSRVFLNVHWPTDVIGGWCLGFVTVFVCVSLYESSWIRNHRKS